MTRTPRILAACAAVALAAAALPLAFSAADAAGDDGIFQPAPSFRPVGAQVRVDPDSYAALRVDVAALRAALADDSPVLDIPTPAGGTERFEVEETSVMAPGLAAAHPEIGTWSGRSLDRPGVTIALDVTPMGFHAAVRDGDAGTAWYVDPAYNARGTSIHLSYAGASLPRPEEELAERELPNLMRATQRTAAAKVARAGTVEQRVYRLALLSDPKYAGFFGTANVTAEKVTLVNRVNQIYNDDLAVNLQLIDGTDALNLDTAAKAVKPNGPCGAHACFDKGNPDFPGDLDVCWPGTLVRAATVLGQLVGASAYDIGHVVLGVNGGGIAGLGVVGTVNKAQGCTGLPEPVGDFFAIDYVAHEMGHQFGGNHTFDGDQGNCSGGNRARQASVEPGSGSSVMAYAGICDHDDLQPHTDPYFSHHTLDEVAAFTGGAPRPQIEAQTVSLRGFDTDGESILIGYDGGVPVTLTRGVDYDAAGVEAAVEQVTGTDVTVAGWGYDANDSFEAYPAPLTEVDDTGFTVLFAGDADPDTRDSDFLDMLPLDVTSLSPGVSTQVGETAQGGPSVNGGSQVNPTDNHPPVVTAPPARTLPMRTPFTLTGSATDEDGDPVSYIWEQTDTGDRDGTSLTTNKRFNGPLFRIFGRYADVSDAAAGQSPSPGQNLAGPRGSRTFPDLRQILAGNTNAATGRCPSVPPASPNPNKYVPVKLRPLNCYSEFLPVPGYVGTAGSNRPAMHFRLIARDGRPGGGGVGYDDVTLRLDRKAGPFLVDSFRGQHVTVRAGSKRTITWQVNGTRKLAGKVRITLSTDNGRTWDHVLAKATKNDGRAAVRFPRVRTARAWVKISAVGNYFFDVNDTRFRIR